MWAYIHTYIYICICICRYRYAIHMYIHTYNIHVYIDPFVTYIHYYSWITSHQVLAPGYIKALVERLSLELVFSHVHHLPAPRPGYGWQEKPIPSGYVKIAMENGHRNSGCSHSKWWLSIAMLVITRGYIQIYPTWTDCAIDSNLQQTISGIYNSMMWLWTHQFFES